MRSSWSVLCGLVLGLGVMSGCVGEGEDMLEMSQEDAKSRVAQEAEIVREAAGAERFSQQHANVTPCDGGLGESSDIEKIYYIQGIYQMLIPPAEHQEVLNRVRAALEQQGWTMDGERSFSSGGGLIKGNSAGDYSALLATGEGRAMSLMVSSPCYRVPGR